MHKPKHFYSIARCGLILNNLLGNIFTSSCIYIILFFFVNKFSNTRKIGNAKIGKIRGTITKYQEWRLHFPTAMQQKVVELGENMREGPQRGKVSFPAP